MLGKTRTIQCSSKPSVNSRSTSPDGAKRFDLELDFVGTDFQKRVWMELLEIPFGETRTYGQIAKRLGNENAMRAVGAANGQNPIPIVAPCHRVIGASGSLVGFGGGLEIKAALLELERGELVVRLRFRPLGAPRGRAGASRSRRVRARARRRARTPRALRRSGRAWPADRRARSAAGGTSRSAGSSSERVDELEPRRRPERHADGDRAIELDDRRAA